MIEEDVLVPSLSLRDRAEFARRDREEAKRERREASVGKFRVEMQRYVGEVLEVTVNEDNEYKVDFAGDKELPEIFFEIEGLFFKAARLSNNPDGVVLWALAYKDGTASTRIDSLADYGNWLASHDNV